jgi:PAS domain S-box-containing protein
MVSRVDDQNAIAVLSIDTITTAVIAVSSHGIVLSCNRAAESMFAMERARAVGTRFVDWIAKVAPESVTAFADALARAAGGGVATLEFKLERSSLRRTARLRAGDAPNQAVIVVEIVAPSMTESTSDLRLRGLLEASPDAMVIADREGRILLLNAQAQRLFGYKVHELLGQELDVLVPERFRTRHHEQRESYFAAPRTRAISLGTELYGRRKDGSEFPAEISLAPLDSHDSTVVIAAIRDITQRKRVEEKVLQLAALVESSLDGIVGENPQGLITSWNLGAERIFGFSAQELIGRPITIIIPPQLSHEEAEILASIRRGQPVEQFVTKRRRKDGVDIDVAITVSPIRDASGAVIGASKVVRDITEVKQSEAALRRAKDEAEAANRDLEAFSYSVAHDLRAPLRAIEGFSRVLLKDYESELPLNARHYLQRVHRSALSMAELIDDLLLLARVTQSELRETTVDLAMLGNVEIVRLRETHPDRDVEFVCGPALVNGDPGLLRVLIGNLISNAWKFSSRNPRARIEFGAFRQEAEQVFFVRDNGAGFEMAYADKLFLPFQRLHRQDEFAGSGIGLATSDRIVRRHGGRIWATAAVGEGATFYFTIGAKRG